MGKIETSCRDLLCSHCGEKIDDGDEVLVCIECKARSHEACWTNVCICAIPGCSSRIWERAKERVSTNGFSLKRYEGGLHPMEASVHVFFSVLFIYAMTSSASFFMDVITVLTGVTYFFYFYYRVLSLDQRYTFSEDSGLIESYYRVFGIEFLRHTWTGAENVVQVQLHRERVLGVWCERMFLVSRNEEKLMLQQTYDLGHLQLLPISQQIAESLGVTVVVKNIKRVSTKGGSNIEGCFSAAGCISTIGDDNTPMGKPPCPVCGEEINNEEVLWCSDCHTPYHKECWSYAGGCSVFACNSITAHDNLVPEDSKRTLIPVFSSRFIGNAVLAMSLMTSYLALKYSLWFIVLQVLLYTLIGPHGPFLKTMELDSAARKILVKTSFLGYEICIREFASTDELTGLILRQELDESGQAKWSLEIKCSDGDPENSLGQNENPGHDGNNGNDNDSRLTIFDGAKEFAEVLSENSGLSIEYIAIEEAIGELSNLKTSADRTKAIQQLP